MLLTPETAGPYRVNFLPWMRTEEEGAISDWRFHAWLDRVDDDRHARLGGKRQGYLVAIIVNEDNVYAYEAWGPKEQFEKDLGGIEGSVRTVDP